MSSGQASALVVLTRPEGRNESLARGLADQGFEPLLMPALGIVAVSATNGVPLPADHDLLVFVSGQAVSSYFQQLSEAGQLPLTWPVDTWVAGVGAATARAIARTGQVPVQLIVHPDEAAGHDSEALWQVLASKRASLRKVLIVRGQSGREWLGQRLEEAGAHVVRHVAYERHMKNWPEPALRHLRKGLEQGKKVICLLTSAHGVEAFIDNAGRHGMLDACKDFHYVVIHPRIAGRLQSLLNASSGTPGGLAVTICAPQDSAMLEAVTSLASL